MKVAIMQPTYLPWLGYFELMDSSDVFVLLDDVQFVRKSFHQRNYIKTPNGPLLLTVPVLKKGKRQQLIKDVCIKNTLPWQRKHYSSIKLNYENTSFFSKYNEELKEIYSREYKYLSVLNIQIINFLKNALGINTELVLSSELKAKGKRTDKIVNICKALEADILYDTKGATDIIDLALFKENSIEVLFQDYQHPIYRQPHGEFIPFLTALDLLFNEGDQALDIDLARRGGGPFTIGSTNLICPKKTILMTSASQKRSLYQLICEAAERIDKEMIVLPADSRANVLFNYMSDKFTVMPETIEDNLNELTKFLLENDIRIVFPTRDGELEFWAQYKDKLRELDIDVIVSPLTSVRLCLDKLEFFNFGSKMYFPFVETFATDDSMSLRNRYVAKNRFGGVTKDVFLNVGKYEVIELAKRLPDPIFQPFIEGREFSADAWINKHHEVKGMVLRSRDLVIGGESKSTTTFRNDEIERKLTEILCHLELVGPIVIQGIIDSNGEIHIIECNPRIGGASALSTKAGLDSLYWSMYESLGYNVDKLPFNKADREIRQIRIPTDVYKYGDCI